MKTIKGIVIAGTHSGVGKTTIAIGMMTALRRRGLRVASFKVGPDFIDPGHHTQATGNAGCNLDGWMLSQAYNLSSFRHLGAMADGAVVEGVMGLFDGAGGDDEAGSTAQIAKWLGLKVLLVVDAAGLARSAAALVQGYERFDPELRFAGVLFNNLGGAGHLTYLKEALTGQVAMPVLGGLVRDEALHLSERHLGLVTAEDRPLSGDFLQRLADRLEAGLDLDRLWTALPETAVALAGENPPLLPAVRIGVARDPAFCFYYPDNLALLQAAGAVLAPFSPLNDTALPENLDGLYFGGGYPELHAARLAANERLRRDIRLCSQAGMPIYAECGGFMYLCRELRLANGATHPMCGCFPFRTGMHSRLRRLGYRQVRLTRETLLGPEGAVLRGHEFHYSDLEKKTTGEMSVETAYALSSSSGKVAAAEGYMVRHTLGSYVHLHWGSRPESAKAFVKACRKYGKRSEHM